MSDSRCLLLSLKPEYADLVLAGAKTVELRRVRPDAAWGTPVLFYASSPRSELVGIGIIDGIRWGSPKEIWATEGPATGLRRSRFDAYFAGAQRAVAITIRDVRPFAEPIPLAEVRHRWPRFHPPQSFRYLTAEQVADLVGSPTRRARPARLSMVKSASQPPYRHDHSHLMQCLLSASSLR